MNIVKREPGWNVITSEEVNEMERLYSNSVSTEAIGRIFGLSGCTIAKHLKKRGIELRGPRTKIFGYDYFESIDTEAKSYWLGFITADGSIRKGLTAVCILLKYGDKHHLERFLKDIGANYKITELAGEGKRNPAVRVEISSVEFVKHLLNLGITPKKTFTIKPCDKIPKQLIRHYWRGMIDGDGHIGSHVKDKAGNPYWKVQLSGNQYMIQGFDDFLHERLGFHGNLYFDHKRNYRLDLGARERVYRALDLLYEGSTVYLPRKYETWIKVKKQYSPLFKDKTYPVPPIQHAFM